jgi:hypothetical protein
MVPQSSLFDNAVKQSLMPSTYEEHFRRLPFRNKFIDARMQLLTSDIFNQRYEQLGKWDASVFQPLREAGAVCHGNIAGCSRLWGVDTITAIAVGGGVFVSSCSATSARSEKRRELHGAFKVSEETVEKKF